ncbi:n-acyl-d-glucosamine 2-epimerase [Pedobacter sp.]
MNQYIDIYKKELLHEIVPFWSKNSLDKDAGGYFTCLDAKGNVYDTDKFAWLHGRQIWTYSMLFDKVEAKQEWKDIAELGASFMRKHGRDANGDWYFSFTKEGKPLVQPYNIFSDCFATMGFGALCKINQSNEDADIALKTFHRILERRNNPKGKYSKGFPGTRDLKNFSLPMILCNLSLELEHLLDKSTVDGLIDEVLHEVMSVFYQPQSGLILENVYQDGSFSDSFEGRLVNPGHIIEAMWFIMDLAVRKNDKALIDKALEIAFAALEFGWDEKYEGILYFKDIKGHPVQQLEWDQKLWWVHVEALVTMAKGYTLTQNQKCVTWFERLHNYTWKSFRDQEHGGEWYGYLNRRGGVSIPAKGGKWKGCFHVPRALYQVYNTLENTLVGAV